MPSLLIKTPDPVLNSGLLSGTCDGSPKKKLNHSSWLLGAGGLLGLGTFGNPCGLLGLALGLGFSFLLLKTFTTAGMETLTAS